ncbi:DUF5698 domain-containing protein [Botrimarina sp.]|uniref:DUF5698 domain-containing protein n=1 Tax=Botrimarina sp. TaxID=2795802 RepID=UPI0032ED86B9
MHFLDALPLPALAALIFALRVVDVSIGTFRTIAVVRGRVATSVALGFFEVLVWVTTVTHVIQRASDNGWLLLAYAGGFSAGNAAGIWVDRRLALGSVIVRIVSRGDAGALAERLRTHGPRVLTFQGSDRGEPLTLLYIATRRRRVRRLIESALEIDPDLLYAIDQLGESNWLLGAPMPTPSGWRAWAKKK